MDLSDGVSVRLSALCLTRRGRLSSWQMCERAVRAGLVLDLGLEQRLESTAESVLIDTTPTGFPPADRLLDALTVEPERSLHEWLDVDWLDLRDLADANVAAGRWSRRRWAGRRFRDLRPEATAEDLARRPTAVRDAWSAADACVTAVAGAAGLLDRERGVATEPPAALLAATGQVEWLARSVCTHLSRSAESALLQAGALRAGLRGPMF